jgi:V/A-type H+-transporting ATPase subunit F
LIEEEIACYKDLPLPAITVIPGRTGGKGIGLASIKRAVERAVGADILK